MFKIEITSLQEFITFVKFLKGDDDLLIKELDKNLKDSNKDLQEAVNQNIKGE